MSQLVMTQATAVMFKRFRFVPPLGIVYAGCSKPEFHERSIASSRVSMVDSFSRFVSRESGDR